MAHLRCEVILITESDKGFSGSEACHSEQEPIIIETLSVLLVL